MRRFLISIVLLAGMLSGASAADHTVMMILFRGVTAAENGFTDYLKSRLSVDFVTRDIGGDPSNLPAILEEAKRTRPDLIYAFGTTVAVGTVGAIGKIDPAHHIADIPVVFNIVADPVGAGLVKEFGASGRNVTGVSHLVPLRDQLKVMERFKPVKKLGVIYNSYEANSLLTVVALRKLAGEFHFKLEEISIFPSEGTKPNKDDIATATRDLLAAQPDFIYLPSDSSLIPQAALVVDLATARSVPVISATEAPIRRQRALLGLVSNYYNAGTFAGYKAEQILTGKTSASLTPIETLKRFSLVVNMTTATKLGIYPPMDMLKLAELVR